MLKQRLGLGMRAGGGKMGSSEHWEPPAGRGPVLFAGCGHGGGKLKRGGEHADY